MNHATYLRNLFGHVNVRCTSCNSLNSVHLHDDWQEGYSIATFICEDCRLGHIVEAIPAIVEGVSVKHLIVPKVWLTPSVVVE